MLTSRWIFNHYGKQIVNLRHKALLFPAFVLLQIHSTLVWVTWMRKVCGDGLMDSWSTWESFNRRPSTTEMEPTHLEIAEELTQTVEVRTHWRDTRQLLWKGILLCLWDKWLNPRANISNQNILVLLLRLLDRERFYWSTSLKDSWFHQVHT